MGSAAIWIALGEILLYTLVPIVFLRRLPFVRFPFYWAFFWGTLVFNVIGAPQLVGENWYTPDFAIALFVLWIGFMAVGMLLFEGRKRLGIEVQRHSGKGERQSYFELGTLVAVSLVLIMGWTALSGPPLLFKIASLQGLSAAELIALRMEAQFGGAKFHWFQPGFHLLPVVALFAAYALLLRRPVFRHKAMFWSLLVFALVGTTAFLNKDGAVVVAVGLLLVYLFERRSLSVARAGLVGAAALVAVIALYVVYDPAFLARGQAAQGLWDRVFVSYSRAAAIGFSLWPDQEPLLYGATVVNPGGVLPYQSVDLSQKVFPYAYETEVLGSAPVPAFAEGYVNLLWPGVLLSIALCFALVVAMQAVFARIRYGPLEVGLLAILVYSASEMAINSVFYSLLHPTNIIFYIAMLTGFALVRPERKAAAA